MVNNPDKGISVLWPALQSAQTIASAVFSLFFTLKFNVPNLVEYSENVTEQ